jgi:chromosome segregation ATPase
MRSRRSELVLLSVCLFLALALSAPAAPAEEPTEPSDLEALEASLAEMAREVEELAAAIAREKEARAEAARLRETLEAYLGEELAKAVGFATDARGTDLPEGSPDVRRIRTALETHARELAAIDLWIPEGTYREDEEGGLVREKKGGRLRIGYVAPEDGSAPRARTLEGGLGMFREATKRMVRDITNLVSEYGILRDTTGARLREQESALAMKERAVKRLEWDLTKLTAEHAQLFAAREQLRKDFDRLQAQHTELTSAYEQLQKDHAQVLATNKKLEAALELLRDRGR